MLCAAQVGGSSLDAMGLTIALKEALGLHLTTDQFLLFPTVGMLAGRVALLKQAADGGMPTLVRGAAIPGEWYPASDGQQQMVACEASNPGMYNMPTTIEFSGTVDMDILRSAFHTVVSRHQNLRTVVRIDATTDQVEQRCLPLDQAGECFELTIDDVADDDQARRLIERESGYRFDLGGPPIVRGCVARLPSEHARCFLLVVQHHVCSDGWSRTNFRKQLLEAYLLLARGDSLPTIANPPVQYADWTLWQRRLFEHGLLERQLSYWRKELAELPPLELPLDHPRPPVLSSKGARLSVNTSTERWSRFQQLLNQHDANAFVGLLSLYFAVLGRFSAATDFAIGVAMGNRTQEGMKDALGYYANEVTIRCDLSGSPSFEALLGRGLSTGPRAEGVLTPFPFRFHAVPASLCSLNDRASSSPFEDSALQSPTRHGQCRCAFSSGHRGAQAGS